MHKIDLKRQQMHFKFYECNFITQRPPTCFDYSCGHLQGGRSKNKRMLMLCRYHTTDKNHMIVVTMSVKW